MILYHGSIVPVEKPEIRIKRKSFGISSTVYMPPTILAAG